MKLNILASFSHKKILITKKLFGYISEAERLEERRSKMRQAEAIENAADNLGMFSGDLTVEIH